MLTRPATNDRDDRAPEDSRLSSSLIMIHRHTARLIVYRSFTMPANQPASEHFWRCRAYTIHMHLCTFFFGPAVFHLVYNFARSTLLAFCLFVARSRYSCHSSISLIMVPDSCVRFIRFRNTLRKPIFT